MQGIEAITAEILASAKSEAEEAVRKAEEFKAAKLAELDGRLAAQKTERETLLEKEADSVVERRLTLAALEARMSKLGAKQAVISKAYDLALAKFRALPDEAYRGLFARLLERVAEDGDTVTAAATDKARLDKNWLDGVSARLGKKLSLAADNIDAKGGIIVSGKVSETDLTLETLIGEIREKSEGDVVAALFG